MWYIYFVSYAHSSGFGNAEVYCAKKIKSLDDIKDIQNQINKRGNVKDIVILSFTLFREEP